MSAALWAWMGWAALLEVPAAEPSTGSQAVLQVSCQLPVGRVLVLQGAVVTTCPGDVAVEVPANQPVPLVVALGQHVAAQTEVAVLAGQRVRVTVTNVGGTPTLETRPGNAANALPLTPMDTLTQDPGMMPRRATANAAQAERVSPWRSWQVQVASVFGLVGVGLAVAGLAALLGGLTQTALGARPPPAATATLPGFLGNTLVFSGPVLVLVGVALGTLGGAVLVGSLLLGWRPRA